MYMHMAFLVNICLHLVNLTTTGTISQMPCNMCTHTHTHTHAHTQICIRKHAHTHVKENIDTYLTFPVMVEPGLGGWSLPLLFDLPPAILCFCSHTHTHTHTKQTPLHQTHTHTHVHTHTHTHKCITSTSGTIKENNSISSSEQRFLRVSKGSHTRKRLPRSSTSETPSETFFLLASSQWMQF